MKRVAIVVQRWHPDLAGGSEQHAGLYARYIADSGVPVDLITTTAKDAVTWQNHYDSGMTEHDGFRALRFPVAGGRRADWNALHDLMLREAVAIRSEAFAGNLFDRDSPAIYPPKIRWPRALQEEWIRRQGPDSPELVTYLAQKGDQYGCIIFLTYLFATCYFGSARVGPEVPTLFVPTLHDEAPAYLPAFQRMAGRFDGILWNTEAEEQLGRSLWGPFPNKMLHRRGGMGIAMPEAEPGALNAMPNFAGGFDPTADSFALYCGRISLAKGCGEMIEWFLDSLDTPAELDARDTPAARESSGEAAAKVPRKLILTGDLQMELPEHPALIYAGFVSEAQKFALMSAARMFIMPSGFESLSVVTLEAMGQGTPVLGSDRSPVIQDHILRSGVGRMYRDRESFASGLRVLGSCDAGESLAMQSAARSYVADNYSHETVRERVLDAIRLLAGDSGN
ncbi:MAG: glycosyltransferase family 4 protein [bacterium]|nr:glycosyltransferase family 4 protein [bacterium]